MKQAQSLLLKENIAAWFRARGFVLVLVAALIPAGITAAWVYSHQGDIAVTGLEWSPEGPEVGDLVNITATIENRFPRDAPAFDVQIEVGFVRTGPDQQQQWQSVFNERVHVDGLAAEDETQVEAQWAPTERDLGTLIIRVIADPDDELRESQTANNFRLAQIQVHSPTGVTTPSPAMDPEGEDQHTDEAEGENQTGDGNETPDGEDGVDGNQTNLPQTDVRLVRLEHPPALFVQDEVNITAVAVNHGPDDLEGATLRMIVERERVSGTFVDQQVTDIQVDWVEIRNDTFTLDIESGGEAEQTLSFIPNQVTRYRVHAFIELDGVAHDPVGEDNEISQTFMVDRREAFPEAPDENSAKVFYQTYVLDLIHLKIIVPLIALFYAGGVLLDERRKNTLPYLFTRPVPRWTLPVIRFAVSFVVAGAAVTIGVLAVNAILLGQPGADVEFLYWPLGLTLGALFVYGAVFTLLGVVSERPYLWGLLYVIGVEGLIFFGRALLINDVRFFQTWAEFLSLNHWFLQVYAAWDPTRVVAPWLDAEPATAALVAGLGLAAIGIGGLIASAKTIQNRDIDM